MFGAFLDAAMSIPRQMWAEEMQDDVQADQSEKMGFQQRFAAEQAASARDWAERMSNTAHQRQMGDLAAAGLNPILSARAGAQAASAGAAASAGVGSSGSGSASHTGTNFAAAQVMEEQKELIHAQRLREHRQGELYVAQGNREYKQAGLLEEQEKTQRELTHRAKADAETATSAAKGAALEGEIDETTYGKIMRYINRAVRGVTGGASAYGNISR